MLSFQAKALNSHSLYRQGNCVFVVVYCFFTPFPSVEIILAVFLFGVNEFCEKAPPLQSPQQTDNHDLTTLLVWWGITALQALASCSSAFQRSALYCISFCYVTVGLSWNNICLVTKFGLCYKNPSRKIGYKALIPAQVCRLLQHAISKAHFCFRELHWRWLYSQLIDYSAIVYISSPHTLHFLL